MKEYRGSIKKRSDVNWSCLSLLMHFDGPIVLKVHVEADNLLRHNCNQNAFTRYIVI